MGCPEFANGYRVPEPGRGGPAPAVCREMAEKWPVNEWRNG
jgi:hypothetical protein